MKRHVPIDAFSKRADPMPVGGLFDEEPERPSGLAKAWAGADDWWRSSAMQGLKALAATGREFDAFDVAELGVPEPDHANRWGALFNAAAKQGLIVAAGYHQSRRPGRAGGACRTWRGTGRVSA